MTDIAVRAQDRPPVMARIVTTALRPDVAAGVLIAVEVGGVNDAFGAPLPGLPSFHLLTLLYATSVLAIGLLRRQIRPVWTPLFAFWLLYAVVRGVSATVTTLPSGITIAPVADDLRSFVFFVVCTTLLCAVDRPRRMVIVATLAVAAGAAVAIIQEFAFHNTTDFLGYSRTASVIDAGGATVRHTGPQPDANFWGRTLVLFAPFALSLAATARLRRAKAWWIATAGVFAVGVWLSGSRAAMLVLAVAVVGWLVLGGKRRARLLLLVPVVLAVVLALPGVGSRLATLSGGASSDEPSLRGRFIAQQTAFTLISEHPVFGVGAGNFEKAAPDVLRRNGARTDRVLAPHNLYLEVASETGVVGALCWVLVLGAMLTTALRGYLAGRRRLPAGIDDVDTLILAGAFVGLAAWALCSVTLHMANVRFLLVVAALTVTFDRRIAERIRTAPRQLPLSSTSSRRPIVAVTAITVGTAVAAITVAVVAVAAPTRWSSAASVAVVPRDSGAGAYEYDLLSRGTVVASVTELLRAPGPAYRSPLPEGVTLTVRRTARPERSSVLSVVATGPDRQTVARLAPAVAARVTSWIDGLGTIYTARPIASAATPPVRAPIGATVPLGAGLLAGGAAGAFTALLMRRRQRRVGTRPGDAHSNRESHSDGSAESVSTSASSVGRHDPDRGTGHSAPTTLPPP